MVIDVKHGMTGTRIYNIWQDMKKRCYCKTRKEYARYGGRGITVCPEWQDFLPFYNWALSSGYSDDLTIDRVNVNGNYEPSNCRWATRSEQQNNRRCNHSIAHNGKTKTISQWAAEMRCAESTIRGRITRGKMPTGKILAKPISHPHNITYNGTTKTLNQWSKCTWISYSTLHKRIFSLHWSIEKALTTK